MVDIDNFKRINDGYGHRAGDHVLREIAGIIKGSVRKSDIIARYGGEEFAVILPQTTLEGAAGEAERLRELISEHDYADLTRELVTASLGVAAYPQDGIANYGDLVNLADTCLYEAKRMGKNRVKAS